VGIRPGEKIHEEMITASDSFSTYDLGKYYAILPQLPKWNIADFMNFFKAVKVPQGFYYNSGENNEWLSVDKIRQLIKQHVDTNFKV
jgi:FlaA1/EpsC-like NDP-sugar epimerase